MRKILITSGGTKEYIDGVRVLTNISSGKLGATIVDTISEDMTAEGYEIHFVYVKGSIVPDAKIYRDYIKPIPTDRNCLHLHEVTDVTSVFDVMKKLVPEMDVVIHPMAVSDFGFKPIAKKLKSNDTEAFIESMRERIFKNPKILSHIKTWNPNCFLISFKFENGTTHDELVDIAAESQEKNGCDIVICNSY